MGVFGGLLNKLRGRLACPICDGPVDTVPVSKDILCYGCDTYLDKVDGKLQPITGDRLYFMPFYGVPTPWEEIRGVTFETIKFEIQDDLMDKVLTKDGGVRMLDARWPPGCCVCGKPPTRSGIHKRAIKTGMPGKLVQVRSLGLRLVAKDIPYCDEHSDGIAFDRVPVGIFHIEDLFGLKFRSLAYRNAFYKLNSWKWRKED